MGRSRWHRPARIRPEARRGPAACTVPHGSRCRALPADRAARDGRPPDRRDYPAGDAAMTDTTNPRGMQVWHFSEMAYHPAWPQLSDTYRVLIPSRLYDP